MHFLVLLSVYCLNYFSAVLQNVYFLLTLNQYFYIGKFRTLTVFSLFILDSIPTHPAFEYFFDNGRRLFHTFFLSSSTAIFLKPSVEKDLESQHVRVNRSLKSIRH